MGRAQGAEGPRCDHTEHSPSRSRGASGRAIEQDGTVSCSAIARAVGERRAGHAARSTAAPHLPGSGGFLFVLGLRSQYGLTLIHSEVRTQNKQQTTKKIPNTRKLSAPRQATSRTN
ncbi:unnamed protein product, partial [Iphiclides podalirius]